MLTQQALQQLSHLTRSTLGHTLVAQPLGYTDPGVMSRKWEEHLKTVEVERHRPGSGSLQPSTLQPGPSFSSASFTPHLARFFLSAVKICILFQCLRIPPDL